MTRPPKRTVQLNDDLVALLDREAARRGVSRSALVRTAIEAFLAEQSEAMLSQQIVDGYMRVPQYTPDEWGDVSALTEGSTAELLQRLDHEEGTGGGSTRGGLVV